MMHRERVEYFNISGCRFAVRILGDGRPLMALHPLTGSGDFWIEIGTRAAIENLMMIAPDARAHGMSSATDADLDYTTAHQAADMIALLDALGLGRLPVAGFSMGARVSAYVAAHHPDRVAALGLFAPPPRSLANETARAFVGAADAIRMRGRDQALAELESADPAMAQRIRNMDARAAAACIAGFHADGFEPGADELSRIRCPTSVIGLENDPHPTETARFYASHIKGARYSSTIWSRSYPVLAELLRGLISERG